MSAKKTNQKTKSQKQPGKTAKKQINQTICLIGFMGAGKTATAEALAEKTARSWIDLDEFIEARENRSILQLFENLGESVFREIESDALDEILSAEEIKIIALGGGTWTIEENRELIRAKNGLAIWLDAPFEVCWKRIAKSKESRPMAKNKKTARKLFDARREIYQTVDIKIEVSEAKTPAEIADEITALTTTAKPKRKKTLTKLEQAGNS